MKLKKIFHLNRQNEKGQALVILALSAVSLMALLGLIVDAGNIYLKKQKLQAAIDAASIAGITTLVTTVSEAEGPDPDKTGKDQAEAAAKQMAAFNMQQMGLDTRSLDLIQQDITAQAKVHPVSRQMTLSVDANITVNTLLLGLLGIISTDVAASGEARRNPAIVSLVLDKSWSMTCIDTCPEKLQNMKEAAGAFIDTFLNNVDSIAVITFNHSANVIRPMLPLLPGDKDTIKTQINAIVAESWTNTAAGIELGRTEITNVVTNNGAATKDAVEAIVIMSDGAPTVLSGLFLNLEEGSALDSNTRYLSNPFRDEIWDINANVQSCSAGSNTIADCLIDFAYLDSESVERGKDANEATITNLSTAGESELHKEVYDLALFEADYAKDFRNSEDPKDTGITIYGIALGTLETAAGPYQDILDWNTIKPMFFRAMTNVPNAEFDPVFQGRASNYNATQPEGGYLQTPDSSQLKLLFLEIARRIQLRLIQ